MIFLISIVLDEDIILVISVIGIGPFCNCLVIILIVKGKLTNSFKTKILTPGGEYNLKYQVAIDKLRTTDFIKSEEGKKLLLIAYFFVCIYPVIVFFPLLLSLFKS